MIKNYFKIAWRNLFKSKAYSSINIVGLAIGMAVAMLIGLWIWDELSFDKYHRNHAELAQVMITQTFNGQTFTGPAVAIPLANLLRTTHADDFKQVALCSWNSSHILAVGDKQISKTGMWSQPNFPVMLTLQMLKGSINGLKDPSSILLNQSLAKALFGDKDPMNKAVKMDNKTFMKVAGVYADLPHNTTLYDVNFLMPWEKYLTDQSWVKDAQTEWENHSFQMFVQVNDHVDMDKTTAKIWNITKPHVHNGDEHIQLQPMDRWHLYSDFENGKVVGGRIQFVKLFFIIGVFVLFLACINFMNLSTARSEKRAREVGIRKAIGSKRNQLIFQFLSESVLMAGLAFVLALILVWLSLPFFNGLADKQMSIPWLNPVFWLIALGFTLFTGLVSGSYPAFYLSGFRPIQVLKGIFVAGRFASLPRKVLVVLQFTVSISLIIGTIIVFRQIQYAKDRPVGYTRAGLITVEMNTPDIYGHYDALRNDLLRTDAVQDMAESSSPSTDVESNQIGFDWKGMQPNTTPLFGTIAVTHDFGKTIGWHLKEGRDFSRAYPADSMNDSTNYAGALILNEAAVKLTGFKQPVGQIIRWNGTNCTVIGVIHDMVMESPYTPVKPTIFFLNYGWTNYITVRIKPTMPVREALAKIQTVFKKYNPGSPFEYKFTDEEYAKKFSDEERIGNLATFFAVLAVFISCLGLFGLASFVAQQRTKEIGVRKVLGASVFHLWQMLSKDFVTLVVISCLIAGPIAWYFLHKWLLKYTYHTEISWWIFAASAIGALLITLMTVSFQAIKAALANPVQSLRIE